MIRRTVLMGILAASAAFPAFAAGNPAAVAAIEPFLREDEKAMLAAVLADRTASAEFNADVKLAAGDPKVMKLILDKWRGRIVAFAEADARVATPDLAGTYENYGALMTPQSRAYLLRRLATMRKADRDSLIAYLDSVDSALSSNEGKLTWYTKKVVKGIYDKYREDLSSYLPEPLAQNAKAAAPAAAAALAERRDSAALEQARVAAAAAERAGAHFDGGGAPLVADDVVVLGRETDSAPRLEPSSRPSNAPNLTAEVPSPVDSTEDFMSSVKKMKTGSGPMRPHRYLPSAVGAALGATLGFLLGGPIGALIGAGAGFVAGDIVGGKLFQ